jgi:hypothetical protein
MGITRQADVRTADEATARRNAKIRELVANAPDMTAGQAAFIRRIFRYGPAPECTDPECECRAVGGG